MSDPFVEAWRKFTMDLASNGIDRSGVLARDAFAAGYRSALEASAVPTEEPCDHVVWGNPIREGICPACDQPVASASAVPEPTDLDDAIGGNAVVIAEYDDPSVPHRHKCETCGRGMSDAILRAIHDDDWDAAQRLLGLERPSAATPPGPHTSREEE